MTSPAGVPTRIIQATATSKHVLSPGHAIWFQAPRKRAHVFVQVDTNQDWWQLHLGLTITVKSKRQITWHLSLRQSIPLRSLVRVIPTFVQPPSCPTVRWSPWQIFHFGPCVRVFYNIHPTLLCWSPQAVLQLDILSLRVGQGLSMKDILNYFFFPLFPQRNIQKWPYQPFHQRQRVLQSNRPRRVKSKWLYIHSTTRLVQQLDWALGSDWFRESSYNMARMGEGGGGGGDEDITEKIL